MSGVHPFSCDSWIAIYNQELINQEFIISGQRIIHWKY